MKNFVSADSKNLAALRFSRGQSRSGLFAGMVVLFASSALAQTNTFPASGNVGIGFPNPTAPLEVNGQAVFDTTGGNGNGLAWSMQSGHNGLMPSLRSFCCGSGYSPGQIESSYLVINGETGGYVGIGTTQPQNMMHVAAPASNSLVWAGILQNPGNTGTGTAVGVGLQFKASLFTGLTETTKWSGIAGVPDIGSNYEDHFGLAFYTHNGSAVTPAEVVRIASSGNVGIGTTNPSTTLEVNGNVTLTKGSASSITFPDTTVQATAWNGVLQGGDYAESVDVSGNRAEYEPGDVLVIDPSGQGRFLKSSMPYATTVAGIYSTRPGIRGRRQATDSSHMPEEVPMAMIGVVPTKVTAEGGPIQPGDLLVTSSTAGYAMKGTDHSRMMGAIIGKAMGHLDSSTGVMEVLVSLQ